MNKTEIIDAAFRVWGRNFYRKTSLSQLAGELGVSKTALYRHFENKQALTAAMAEYFIDDFSAYVKDDFAKALRAKDVDNGISTIVLSISSYFAKNAYLLIFSLINIYNRNLDKYIIADSLKSHGADMNTLRTVIGRKYKNDSTIIRLIFTTLTFFMVIFHKTKKAMENPLSNNNIKNINTLIYNTIKTGLGYSAKKTIIDFDKLEKLVEKTTAEMIAASSTEHNEQSRSEPSAPFFKAVAEAVAEAGPWDVSMDMVAKKIGLSKSSLYGHFKNRKDMLRRLFKSEFTRIIKFARQGISISGNTAEQLYLGIYSISIYLRSRPEILIAMDWIRTRNLDLGKPDKKAEIFRLFEDVDIEPLKGATEEEKQRVSHWILFLLINILMFPTEKKEAKNYHIRVLYKFITMGLGGFIQ